MTRPFTDCPAGWSANVAVPSTRVLQPDALAQVEVFARAPPEAAEGVRAIPILARVDGSDVVFRATWNVTVLPPLPQPEPDPQPEPEPTRTGEDPGVVPPGERPADAPAVAVSLGESALAVGPGESVSTVLRVENTGNVALALAVSGSVPEGWSPLAFEAASFDLAPGAARDVRVTLSAPSDAVPDPRGTGHGSVVVTSASGLLRSLPYTVRVVPAAPRDASTSTSAPAATLDGDAAPVSGFAVGVAVGVGTVGAGALALSSRPLREKLLWLGVGLYTRLARPDVLGHEERDRLYKMIESRPGVHFHALQRDLAWNTGTLTYHLRVLERHGFVVSRRDGLYRRFYLSGAAPRKETFNQGPQGLRADVLEAVRGQPGISQSDLALALGQNKQTVNYHVKALERQGALRIEKRGRDTYLYPVLPGDVPAQPGAA
ncbi:MAG TPA: winged helix-turn-helix transcriptional regulator [Candidatus Thermoplasmatota archaeon]|nr:winged helix-turn-helix transcriptional regulator [Candidatus Thermoplasmatota archaeon]